MSILVNGFANDKSRGTLKGHGTINHSKSQESKWCVSSVHLVRVNRSFGACQPFIWCVSTVRGPCVGRLPSCIMHKKLWDEYKEKKRVELN